MDEAGKKIVPIKKDLRIFGDYRARGEVAEKICGKRSAAGLDFNILLFS